MRLLTKLWLIIGAGLLASCQAPPKKPPTQVVYRFDDHRYLELKGFYCEGALRYVDEKRNIRYELVGEDNPIFRISFFKYIHPSEKYISIPWDDLSGFLISKDYGRTWEGASFAPGGGADPYGKRIPRRKKQNGLVIVAGEDTNPIPEDIISFTVVNDQGFMLTKWGDIYMSSKPFDDPRLEPGGSGITYSLVSPQGFREIILMRPGYGGGKWGKEYASWNSFAGPNHWTTDAYRANFQGIPNKIPEVKNYRGWDRMRCDPSLGL